MSSKNRFPLRPIHFDRYILEEVLGNFFGASLFILFILLMFQALRLMEFFIVHNVSGFMLSKLAFFMGLSLLPVVIPLAFLIAVLMTFSRLSLDSELVAMKSNGYGVVRLSAPVALLALFITLISLALNVEWIPWGETAFKKTEIRIRNTKAVSAVKEGTFTFGFFDLLIFAEKVDEKTNRLNRVFIFDEREAGNPLTYVSRTAEIVPVSTVSEFGSAIMLHLFNGSTHHQDISTRTYEKMDFETYNLYLKIDGGADTALLKPHMIPHNHLLQLIKEHGLEKYEGREFRGEYWRRVATALTPLIFVLLGIGFGTVRYRTAKTGAVLTGFVILIIYWALQTAGTSALQRGTLHPFWAMQLPNVIMLIGGIWGFRRAAW